MQRKQQGRKEYSRVTSNDLERKEIDQIKISVVIPVYNVEEYVEECLESVLRQSTPDIEAIVVNDGSADNSYAICQKTISKWKDCTVILLDQENQGLAAARNNGMSMAHGDYIMFLDSDDMLIDGTFVKLKQYISEFQDVELFFYDAMIRNDIGEAVSETRYIRSDSVDSAVVSGKEYFEKYYFSPMIVSSCMCLYKADLLRCNHFVFEAGRLYEDIFFSFRTVLTAKSVLYIPEALYVRRYRADSITTVKKTSKHVQDHMYAYEQCMRFAEKDCNDKRICNSLYYFMYAALLYFKNMQIKENDDKKRIEQFYNDILLFFCRLSKTQKSFTFYKGLSDLLKFGEDNQLAIKDENAGFLRDILDMNANSEIKDFLEETIHKFYREIFSNIPFKDNNSIIGIYGSGKHSRQLVDEYQKQNGKIMAKMIFIDSQKKSFTEKYLDCDVINIRDAEKYVDIVIISSFIHHLELKNLCKRYISKKFIDIIDFYEEERISLF